MKHQERIKKKKKYDEYRSIDRKKYPNTNKKMLCIIL